PALMPTRQPTMRVLLGVSSAQSVQSLYSVSRHVIVGSGIERTRGPSWYQNRERTKLTIFPAGAESSCLSGLHFPGEASRPLHRRQGFLDLLHSLRRFLSDKFQRHVQGLRPDPARIGRKLTHAIHEAANAVADGIFDVEGDENTHSTR